MFVTNISLQRKDRLAFAVLLAHHALPLVLVLHPLPFFLALVKHDAVAADRVRAEVAEHDVAAITAAAAVNVMVVVALPRVLIVLCQTRLAQIHVAQERMVHQVLLVAAVRTELSALRGAFVVVRRGVERLCLHFVPQLVEVEVIAQLNQALQNLVARVNGKPTDAGVSSISLVTREGCLSAFSPSFSSLLFNTFSESFFTKEVNTSYVSETVEV